MKKLLAAAVMVLSFAPSWVSAQERVGDAALGALSGAVVLGPVGAVAGAVVGYTAGPAIARSWRLRRSGPGHQKRSAKRSATAAPDTGRGATQGAPHVDPPHKALARNQVLRSAPRPLSRDTNEEPTMDSVRLAVPDDLRRN